MSKVEYNLLDSQTDRVNYVSNQLFVRNLKEFNHSILGVYAQD